MTDTNLEMAEHEAPASAKLFADVCAMAARVGKNPPKEGLSYRQCCEYMKALQRYINQRGGRAINVGSVRL